MGSPEYRSHLIDGLYQAFLKRAPDSAGKSGFDHYLVGGGTVDGVRASILGSLEYFNLHGGTNDRFVAGLYPDVLGRAADPSGQAFWLQQLANGKSRADVALAMLSGPEAKQVLVKGFYVRFLKRQADSNGLAMFQNQLLHGVREEAVIVEIVASTEYYARP